MKSGPYVKLNMCYSIGIFSIVDSKFLLCKRCKSKNAMNLMESSENEIARNDLHFPPNIDLIYDTGRKIIFSAKWRKIMCVIVSLLCVISFRYIIRPFQPQFFLSIESSPLEQIMLIPHGEIIPNFSQIQPWLQHAHPLPRLPYLIFR